MKEEVEADVLYPTTQNEEQIPILNTQESQEQSQDHISNAKPPMPWYRIFLMSIFYYGKLNIFFSDK